MIKDILNTKNPDLRKISKPVLKFDKKIKSLINDLIDTLSVQDDPEGVGLAAPQIGKNVRIFVIKPEKITKVFINPKVIDINKAIIDKKSEKEGKKDKKIMEGCLSLPNFYGPIKRNKIITIKFLDEKYSAKTQTFKGLDAQIVQHEIDHLNGILFIDRLLEQKKPLYEYIDGEWEEVEL